MNKIMRSPLTWFFVLLGASTLICQGMGLWDNQGSIPVATPPPAATAATPSLESAHLALLIGFGTWLLTLVILVIRGGNGMLTSIPFFASLGGALWVLVAMENPWLAALVVVSPVALMALISVLFFRSDRNLGSTSEEFYLNSPQGEVRWTLKQGPGVRSQRLGDVFPELGSLLPTSEENPRLSDGNRR